MDLYHELVDNSGSRKRKLFYSENPLELTADLLKIFEKFLDSIQIYNKVVQGTPIPHHRVSTILYGKNF